MSILSPEPAPRGSAKAEARAVLTAGTADADAGFMAVLAEALAAWSERSGDEHDADTDETMIEMSHSDEDPMATARVAVDLEAMPPPAAAGDEADSEAMAGVPIDGEPEIRVADALGVPVRVNPSADSVASNDRVLGTETFAPIEGDDALGSSSTGETTNALVDPETPAPPADVAIDEQVDAPIRGQAEGGRTTGQPPADVDQQADPDALASHASANAPGLRRVAEVDTAGRSASRLVSDGQVSSAAAADVDAPAPSKAPLSSAQAMFDAELAAQEADEDPWLQVARVVRPLRQLADGSHRIALQLRPAELGTVHLEVALEDGRLSMRAVTETVAARDAFAGSLPELRAELSRSGIDLGSLDVGDETMDGQGDRASGRPSAGGGDGAAGAGPAPDAQSSVGAAHPPSSGSATGAGAGRLDLTL